MVELIWTEPAIQDLEVIADYIALDKPEAAKKLVSRIFEKVENLKRFPKLGSSPRELHGMSYRQLVISPCRVFYRVEEKKIFILHVMRGEQLLHAGLFEMN